MANIFDILLSWVFVVVPQPCFDEYFVNYNLFNVDCLKIVISKCLGLGIILGSVLVKVPQILKLFNAKSSEGINLSGLTLEIFAVSSSLAYGYAKGFPFSAYGESMFLVLQTGVIAFLVQVYAGKTGQALAYCAVCGGALALLMSPVMPMSLLQILQALVMPNMALARSLQIVSNYHNQSTGQLSAITFGLLFLGSVARIFTSLQETGDMLLILTYITSSTCNAIIVFQLYYYRNSAKATAADKQKRQ